MKEIYIFRIELFHLSIIFHERSGVGAEDAQIIYRYLISSLLPTYLKATKSISALSLSRPLPAVNR